MARVPFGSEVSKLDVLIGTRSISDSEVTQWIAISGIPDRVYIELRKSGVIRKTDFGVYRQKSVGTYTNWYRTGGQKANFTGEIEVFIDRMLANSVVIVFTYFDGKLVKKDWGYLPG